MAPSEIAPSEEGDEKVAKSLHNSVANPTLLCTRRDDRRRVVGAEQKAAQTCLSALLSEKYFKGTLLDVTGCLAKA